MVYDLPDDHRRELCEAKVAAQLARALRYVQAVGAEVVVPSAGPPCFLDPDLFDFNVITRHPGQHRRDRRRPGDRRPSPS
jgi:UDP-MurNAc hydroxylase